MLELGRQRQGLLRAEPWCLYSLPNFWASGTTSVPLFLLYLNLGCRLSRREFCEDHPVPGRC